MSSQKTSSLSSTTLLGRFRGVGSSNHNPRFLQFRDDSQIVRHYMRVSCNQGSPSCIHHVRHKWKSDVCEILDKNSAKFQMGKLEHLVNSSGTDSPDFGTNSDAFEN